MSEHLISEELKEKLKKVNDNFIEKYGTYLPKDDYAKATNMNKYLFRGIRKDNGKWIEGGYCYCNNKSYIVIATQYIPDTRDWYTADYYEKNPVYEPTFIEVYAKTIGQWSGLTDKKYNKIFEGDIIENPCGMKTSVELINGRFCPFTGNDISLFLAPDECRIVGNIYDNPELIGE